MTRGYFHFALMCVLAAGLAGCGGSPRESFYTLSAGAAPDSSAASAGSTASVAVGPVSLPDVADRPQLVVRSSANRVSILEQHRWAEPLKSAIPRVIAENLSQLLGTRNVSAYPQAAMGDATYRVSIDIQRFESAPGQAVTVDALWTVRRTPGGEPRTGQSSARESAGGADYEGLAAGYSRALATVSRDIAEAIRADISKPH